MMNRLITLLLLIFFSTTLLAGCNTFRGMGQDVQSLGHAISHAAS
ncbi:entericidin A/B family lipoprotein [Pluralibacter gergoviae]|nr:entericidin A [Pluralibacter gergoviae]